MKRAAVVSAAFALTYVSMNLSAALSSSSDEVSVSSAPKGSANDAKKEKLVPRFDGLRFIETLVTAHR